MGRPRNHSRIAIAAVVFALVFVFVYTIGCMPAASLGRARATGATSASASSSNGATNRSAMAATPCEGGRKAIFALASATDLTCRDGFTDCSGTLGVEVFNCGDRDISVERIVLRCDKWLDGQIEVVEFEPTLPIASLGRLALHPKVLQDGVYSIQITVRSSDGVESLPEEVRVEVHNPARTQAMADCDACQGQWGRFGMLQIEGCNCRTRDAGKVCHDGEECEGACLPDGVEVITKAKPFTCSKSGGCSVSLGAKRLVGHCSDREIVFGCHSEIPRGASKLPPTWSTLRGSSICRD